MVSNGWRSDSFNAFVEVLCVEVGSCAGAALARATDDGSALISISIVLSGSIARPSVAVTSAAPPVAAAALLSAAFELCGVKVPRRRKIAEGLSFESLC